jgi:hypothetical protein
MDPDNGLDLDFFCSIVLVTPLSNLQPVVLYQLVACTFLDADQDLAPLAAGPEIGMLGELVVDPALGQPARS